jgi:hypothetical protein
MCQIYQLVYRYIFVLLQDKFWLNLLLCLSFDILMFVFVYSGLVIPTLNNLYEDIFGRKCESASHKLHYALYTFTVAGTSHIMQTSGFIVCTLYSSAHGAFFSMSCKFHEEICIEVISNVNRHSTDEIQNGRPSALYSYLKKKFKVFVSANGLRV